MLDQQHLSLLELVWKKVPIKPLKSEKKREKEEGEERVLIIPINKTS